MHNIEFNKVRFELFRRTNRVIFKCEITNGTGKAYNTVAVRIILFVKNVIVVNEVFLVNSLVNGETKVIERHVYDLQPDQSMDDVTRYELFTENCY
jgi:hypothetical protein